MTKLEVDIKTVLQQLRSKLANETWESRRRYFNQMLELACILNITEPCQTLYDAFIADDNGSEERRSLHIRCVKLLDEAANTKAKDERGIFYNEIPLPDEAAVQEFFMQQQFPLIKNVDISYLIVKSEIEMQYLSLSCSTMGQYRHSWMDIHRYFISNGIADYDRVLMQKFIHEISLQRSSGFMKEWKWKINRKAAFVLMEVAETGFFHWSLMRGSIACRNPQIEDIRLQYCNRLMQRNLSSATIVLYDYVFRKTVDFCEINSLEVLFRLSSEQVQLTISKFASICCRRSIATILPILRSMMGVLIARAGLKEIWQVW